MKKIALTVVLGLFGCGGAEFGLSTEEAGAGVDAPVDMAVEDGSADHRAGLRPDAGLGDASPQPEASQPEASPQADAGSSPDAGSPPDAGNPAVDAGPLCCNFVNGTSSYCSGGVGHPTDFTCCAGPVVGPCDGATCQGTCSATISAGCGTAKCAAIAAMPGASCFTASGAYSLPGTLGPCP